MGLINFAKLFMGKIGKSNQRDCKNMIDVIKVLNFTSVYLYPEMVLILKKILKVDKIYSFGDLFEIIQIQIKECVNIRNNCVHLDFIYIFLLNQYQMAFQRFII